MRVRVREGMREKERQRARESQGEKTMQNFQTLFWSLLPAGSAHRQLARRLILITARSKDLQRNSTLLVGVETD